MNTFRKIPGCDPAFVLHDLPPALAAVVPGAIGWTAIVLAGQRPGVDPLAAAFGTATKALVGIAGRPMLDRVLETVLASDAIARVVVLGQSPADLRDGAASAFRDDPRISWAEGSNGISASLRRIVGTAAAPWPVLVTTADHPLLTPAMIESFLESGEDGDVSVAMVERATILAAYPDTKRTWLRFSDGAWSGANLFALRTPAALKALDLWTAVEQDRKRPVRLFRRFGWCFAFRAITRTISLRNALARVGGKAGVAVELVPLAFAEAAIDVDKPGDHALAEAILRRTGRG